MTGPRTARLPSQPWSRALPGLLLPLVVVIAAAAEPARSVLKDQRLTLHCLGSRESYIHGVHATGPVEQSFTLFLEGGAGRWYDWTARIWQPMASVSEHGYVLHQVDHGAMGGRSMILIRRPGLEWSLRSSNFEMSLQIEGRCSEIALRLPPQIPSPTR